MSEKTNKIILGAIGGIAAFTALFALKRRRRFNFEDKVVLITGGSRGLGLVLARRFAELGARIAICARDAEELGRARMDLEGRGAEVLDIVCDVQNQNDVKRMISEVNSRFGSIDVLVNNAGVIQVGPLEAQTQQDFEEAMAIHFWGPFYTMQEVIPAMRKRSEGRIVNISSIGGKIPVPHLAPYCASKFALSGLSAAMHTELAQDNISVTTVYPGLMRTGSHINAKFKGQNNKEFALFSLSDATPLTSIGVERAAAKIIQACADGDAELVITVQAKLAAKLYALAPELTLGLLGLTNRFLPDNGGIGIESATGLQSTSELSPSFLTGLIDQAAVDNNELKPNEHIN